MFRASRICVCVCLNGWFCIFVMETKSVVRCYFQRAVFLRYSPVMKWYCTPCIWWNLYQLQLLELTTNILIPFYVFVKVFVIGISWNYRQLVMWWMWVMRIERVRLQRCLHRQTWWCRFSCDYFRYCSLDHLLQEDLSVCTDGDRNLSPIKCNWMKRTLF